MSTSFLPKPDSQAPGVDMDPYVIVCRVLKEAGVPFLVIGAFGIDLHASELGLGIVTYDLDLLLPARLDVLERAFRELARAGCTFSWNGEAMPAPEEFLLGDILRSRACITASLDGSAIDLVLHAAKLDFDELWLRREARTLGTLSLDTIPLADLLLSKAAANRLKDRLFIETWRELLDQMLAADDRRRASSGAQDEQPPPAE